jgi:hypothetical protein
MIEICCLDEKSAIQKVNLAMHIFCFHLFIGFDGEIWVSGKCILDVFEGILVLLIFLVFHDKLDVDIIIQQRLE